MPPSIRAEAPKDAPTIEAVTVAAFLDAAHTGHTEQYIVNALRRAGALTISVNFATAARTSPRASAISASS